MFPLRPCLCSFHKKEVSALPAQCDELPLMSAEVMLFAEFCFWFLFGVVSLLSYV